MCNCDVNDDVWRNDTGWITYTPDLPVASVEAGDTGTYVNKTIPVLLYNEFMLLRMEIC